MKEKPVLGIIGGSGLYQFDGLTSHETVEIDTPFGKPSSAIVIGTLAEKRVAFLARHGAGHVISPGDINYRANIYAFKQLGVRYLVGISACGSLREDFAPGHIVIPDQLIDFTKDRKRSFFETGLVAHIGTAEPYCKNLSHLVHQAVSAVENTKVHLNSTLITIEGPRFSTQAESNLFRSWGISVIGMTGAPEAFLAREAEICYSSMVHVTDYDVWHVSEEPVSVEMVVNTLNKNTLAAQKAIENLVSLLDPAAVCNCQNALQNAFITNPAYISGSEKEKLKLLIDKYLPQ